MNQWLIRLYLSLDRHRWFVVGVALVVAVAARGLLSRVRLSEDVTDMLLLSDPAVARQLEALRWVRQADRLYLDVSAPEPDAELLAAAADRLAEALVKIPELEDLRYRLHEASTADLLLRLQAEAPEQCEGLEQALERQAPGALLLVPSLMDWLLAWGADGPGSISFWLAHKDTDGTPTARKSPTPVPTPGNGFRVSP
jgi:hypothetical protein